jgi:hypothetical protein
VAATRFTFRCRVVAVLAVLFISRADKIIR